MSENALSVFDRPTVQRMAAVKAAADSTEEEDALCWGYWRGNRRAFNIEFRRLEGAWPSLEYPWLTKIEWCPVASSFMPGVAAPAGSIILRYSDGHQVLVCGHNLRQVHQKILEHQVRYLSEADTPSQHLAGNDAAVVTRIQIVERSQMENES